MVTEADRITRSPGKLTKEDVKLPVRLLGGFISITRASGTSICITAELFGLGLGAAYESARGVGEAAAVGGSAGIGAAFDGLVAEKLPGRAGLEIDPAIADLRAISPE